MSDNFKRIEIGWSTRLDLAYIVPNDSIPKVTFDYWDEDYANGWEIDLSVDEAHELADWIYANVPKPTEAP